MPDRAKVIKGITHHKLGQCDMSGKICPYWEEEDCMRKMLGDALSLLKEQEGQKPTKQASALMADHHYYACSKCGCMVDYLVWKCYACNQRLNWD